MTKKINKRSVSESTVVEKSEKDGKNLPLPAKKQKLDVVTDAIALTKKSKKPVVPQNNVNLGKNKKENKKNVTIPKVDKNKESQNGDDAPIEQSISRKDKLLLQKAENKKLMREKRKVFRKEEGQIKTKTSKLSIEQIKEKVNELQSRETLTKTAKKKLASFRKLLKIEEEGGNVQKSNDNNVSENNVVEKDKKKLKKDAKSVTVESANKKKPKGQKVVKQVKDETEDKDNEEDVDEDEDMEDLSEEEENKTQVKSKKSVTTVKEVKEDDDDDDDEDEDEDEDEEEEEEEEEVEEEEEEEEEENEEGEKLDTKDDDDDEEEDGDDDDEEGEENEDEDDDDKEIENVEAKKDKKKNVADKKLKKQNETSNNKNQISKKKRFVLYVGNIPYSTTENEIRNHFLTKVSSVADVRIPKKIGSNQSRGFCYVELENQQDYEKGLSLNRTTLQNRMLTVEYTTDSKRDNAKQIITAKNKKFDAMRKQGKFAGSHKQTDKKFKKGFKKNTE